MKERIHWIDIAKGIAIVLVVIGHVVASYHEAGLYISNNLFDFVHQLAYSFHMALFMILSGYLVSLGKKKEATKLKQVIQIIINYGIPYVIFSVVWVLMKIIMSGHTNSAISIQDLILIPVYPISFMWFIYALMIMQIIQVFVNNELKWAKWLHLLLAWGGYFLQPYLAERLVDIRFSDCVISDFLKFYVFFVMGVYLAEVTINGIQNNKLKVIVISGIILLMGNAVKYMGVIGSSKLYSFAIALIGSIFVISISISINRWAIVEFLGRHSLPIYVLQGIAIAATRLLLTRMNLNILDGVFPLVMCTTFGCIVPLCAYWASKRIWKLDGCFYPGKYIKVREISKHGLC